jgi:hypothetical protein
MVQEGELGLALVLVLVQHVYEIKIVMLLEVTFVCRRSYR